MPRRTAVAARRRWKWNWRRQKAAGTAHHALAPHARLGHRRNAGQPGRQGYRSTGRERLPPHRRRFSRGRESDRYVPKWHRAGGSAVSENRSPPGKTACFRDVSLIAGPWVLAGACKEWSAPLTVLATIDGRGRLDLPARDARGCVSVVLPGPDIAESQLAGAIDSAAAARLRPIAQSAEFRAVFVCNVVVVPADSPAAAAASARLKKLEGRTASP